MFYRLSPKNGANASDSGIAQSRFIDDEVIKQYDSLISCKIKDCNVWRLIAFVCLGFLIISLIVLAKTATLPKTELVVIGVNDIGQARYYGKVEGESYSGYDMKESIVKNVLETFVKKTFTISIDADYMRQNFVDCLYFLQAEKRRNYNLEVNQTDPFSQVGRIKQNVKIETIIPISENTYQVDWYNIQNDMSGLRQWEFKKRGLFTLFKLNAEQYNKLTEAERTKNPMGIYIIDYNIVDVEK